MILHEPPVAVAEPTSVVPLNNFTKEFASAVPIIVGVVSLVVKVEFVINGASGAVVSTVTDIEDVPILPAGSVALTCIVCSPSDSGDVVNDQSVVPVAEIIEPESTLYVTIVIPDESDAVPETGTDAVLSSALFAGDTMFSVGAVASVITAPGS